MVQAERRKVEAREVNEIYHKVEKKIKFFSFENKAAIAEKRREMAAKAKAEAEAAEDSDRFEFRNKNLLFLKVVQCIEIHF